MAKNFKPAQLIAALMIASAACYAGAMASGNVALADMPDLGLCGDAFTAVHAIQGAEKRSALVGKIVVSEAVISADFHGADKLNGVYLQSPAQDADSDHNTSEGIFIYDPSHAITAGIGSRVRVLASVGEYNEQTQLNQLKQWVDCGYAGNVAPSLIKFPLADDSALEVYEGMLVTFNDALTVSDTYNLARYGELLLSAGGRLWQPTEVVAPGADASALAMQNARRKIILDDGSTRQNPALIPYPGAGLSHDNPLRVGDEVRPFTAVLAQAFNAYRLQPVTAPIFDVRNARSDAPPRAATTTLRVASFNVLNYFNGDGAGGGFPTSRGASNAAELTRQREKIIAALLALDADVVGLMEMENDGDQAASALNELVAHLNQRAIAGAVWRAIDTGVLGSDAIRVALIYRRDRVSPVGAAERLQSGAFATANRVPLRQKFVQANGLQSVAVVVNHFKSKGSCPSDAGDINADHGDGQGCWNALRTQAANELANWLSAQAPTQRTVLIGDFNAYRQEDPINALLNSGYALLHGDAAAYSFVFDGQSGRLDHGFGNARLQPEVLAAQHWAINADESRALDYNLEFKTPLQQQSLYAATASRSSDHDPLLIDIGPRQFAHNYHNPGWRFLRGKQEQRLSFLIKDAAKVDAFSASVHLLHGKAEALRFALRLPDGVEVPLNATLDGDSVKLMSAKALIPTIDMTGSWQLIVRSPLAGSGMVWGAELHLD